MRRRSNHEIMQQLGRLVARYMEKHVLAGMAAANVALGQGRMPREADVDWVLLPVMLSWPPISK
jgi:hypothetical protein